MVEPFGRRGLLRQLDLTVVDMIDGTHMDAIRSDHVSVFLDLRHIDHRFHSLFRPQREGVEAFLCNRR